MKILAVDDIKENRYLIRKLLEGHGYDVETVGNGVEALESARKSLPDMIITDTLMPRMDGFQLCRTIKSDEKLKNIPVLFYSATYTDKKSQELAFEIGAAAYITKPVESDEFTRIIEEKIERYEKGELKPAGKPLEEPVYMELYNERLIRKLEDKMLDLERSEAKYRSVVEAMDDLICLIDRENRLLSCNKKSLERFGLTPDDVLGKGVSEMITDPVDVDSCMQMVREVFETGKPVSHELKLSIMGERWWYSTTMAPVFGAGGSVTAVACIARDITGRKSAEEALRRAEQEKATILNSLSEHVLYQDAEMRIIWANRAAGESVGLTPDELVGRHCYEIWQQRSEPCVDCPVAKARETGQTQEGEMTTPDGRIWFIRSDPVRDTDGDIVGAVETTLEITGRKLAEEALRESEEWFRTMVETAPSLLQICDAGGDNIFIGPNCEEITGYTREELQGRVIWWVHEDDTPRAKELFDRAFSEGVGYRDFEYKAFRKDGELWYASSSWEPLRDAQGNFKGIVFQTIDITERKNAEQELAKYREHLEELVEEQTSQLEEKTAELEHANIRLQELDRLKSMFIASMSHELRTPLNSIIGFTGMILQGLSGEVSKEANEELRIVYDSAKHLLSLINDVIDISKIEAGQLEAYFEEVDLDEVLRDAVTAVSRDADKKNLEIRTVIQGGLSVTSDRKRLLQCVMNLLENAVKFTEAGTIELIAAKEADTLRISVSDTGIGIREEDIPKLFAPFIRLDSPLKKRTLGTGLGLHLTKKIIKNVFHGNIMVESQYGMGSTFTLIIPLDAVV